jgi:hypothetical protein
MREKQGRTNSAQPGHKGRLRPSWIIAAVCLAAAAFAVFKLVPRSPASRVTSGWAERGVAKPNVILVTLDTTRADHLSCYGSSFVRTPNLDALAARGALFEQAATATPLTLPSHCTILTGMYPTYHGVRVNGNTALNEQQTTLAEVFSARGYRCGAFISAFVLDGRWGLKQGFELYDDQLDMGHRKHIDLGAIQRPGNAVMDAALAWLDGAKNAPFFAWIHLYDPHTPYEPPEPYRSEYGGREPPALRRRGRLMDEQIGRLAAWLRAPVSTNRPCSSSSATTVRAWAVTARSRTAISSTTTPSACRSSSSRPSPGSRASACPRRSVLSMSFRPSSSWPASPESPKPRAGRSCR